MARKRQQQFPAGPLARVWLSVVYFRREIGVTLGVLLTLVVAWMIFEAMQEPEPDLPLEVERVELTPENIRSWAREAKHLARLRDENKLKFQLQTLPAFLEWARTYHYLLDGRLSGDWGLRDFLNVTSSLEHARNRFGELVESDLRFQEMDKLAENLPLEDAQHLRWPPAPKLAPWEQKDVQTYETHFDIVEEALFFLMPKIKLPVAKWEEERLKAEADAIEQDQETPVKYKRPLKWRVVNKSRYGPKVIRMR